MSTLPVVLLGLGMLLAKDAPAAETPDFAALREMLQDRQHPRNQSQAALLLVQSHAPEAESIVREGLRQTETPETFLALAATLRLFPDTRYQPELLEALVRGKPVIRQSAAEALALLADDDLVKHLQALAEDGRVDLAVRKAAVWTLGRSGRKQAALVLLDQLSSNQEVLRLEAAEALADLTGQSFGDDSSAWQAWWEGHQDFSNERWLSERLFYQATRARRLEGELERARGQLVRLHQQLYARLPGADRLGYIQTLAEQEDPNLRVQAVAWSVELLPATDNVGQRTLANALLRLSDDAVVEVQRSATLALGGVLDARAFDRLTVLIGKGLPEVRVAAARALTQQAQRAWEGAKTPEGPVPAAYTPTVAHATFNPARSQVVPVLQKALEDPALEVVIEAAEDLGTLGVSEAGPVLTALLVHPS
ncbi:MAG: hypothetical protein JO112_06345, partial [Planctomycetes bacterium]|nr:hypothetical protein [Planctomycetota bacterium]